MSALPFRAAVIKGAKRFQIVKIIDANGREIDHVEVCESKRFAVEIAAKINAAGRWMTGISGYRYERSLATGERFVKEHSAVERGRIDHTCDACGLPVSDSVHRGWGP